MPEAHHEGMEMEHEQEHPASESGEGLRDAFLHLFEQTILHNPDVTLAEGGMFIVYGRRSLTDQRNLADANSQLRDMIEDRYRKFLHSLDREGRSKMAELLRERQGSVLAVLTEKDPAFPNINSLFETAKDSVVRH